MTDAVEVKLDAEPAAEKVEQIQATPSPVEVEARDQGWVSKEEWIEAGRDESDWRPAKEFVERGELYKSIHQTKRELKQTQAALNALQNHHQMVYEKARQDALAELKMQKRQAIREGDLEALESVEDRIDELQAQHAKERQAFEQAQRQHQGPPPEYDAFLIRNPWYSSDKAMRDEADALGFVYLNNGGDKAGLLTHVEKEIKKRYPEKFGIKRAAPSAVAAPSKVGRPATSADIELDESEREAMKTFVRMGVMTEAQYREELKKAKGRS